MFGGLELMLIALEYFLISRITILFTTLVCNNFNSFAFNIFVLYVGCLYRTGERVWKVNFENLYYMLQMRFLGERDI